MFKKKYIEELTRIGDNVVTIAGDLKSLAWTMDSMLKLYRENNDNTVSPLIEAYYRATDDSQRKPIPIEQLRAATRIVVTDKAYICTAFHRTNGQEEFISHELTFGEYYSVTKLKKLEKYSISIVPGVTDEHEFLIEIYNAGPVSELVTTRDGHKTRALTRIEIHMNLMLEEPFYDMMLGFAVGSDN